MEIETRAETQTALIVYEDGVTVTLPYGDVPLAEFTQEERRTNGPVHDAGN